MNFYLLVNMWRRNFVTEWYLKWYCSRHIRSEVHQIIDIRSEVQHTIYFKGLQFTMPFYMECFHRSTVKPVMVFCIINQIVLCAKRRLSSDTISLFFQVYLTMKLENKYWCFVALSYDLISCQRSSSETTQFHHSNFIANFIE